MADPPVPLSTALRETEFTKLNSAGRFIPPPLFEDVYQRLIDYSECVIVGSPRSGKTYLALHTGKTIRDDQYKGVIYLDFNRIQDAVLDFSEIESHHELNTGDLMIIDNWHSRPDCQSELDRLLNLPKWKTIKRLYLVTRFHTDEDDLVVSTPFLHNSPEEIRLNPINTDTSLLELATKMIENCLTQHYKQHENRPITPILFDEQTVARVLSVSTKYKKMRGNLRYLKWRLDAWNPKVTRLEDVGPEQVAETIYHHLVLPAGQGNLGTLQKVAAVTQWEVPYQVAPGVDVPKEFQELQKMNLIYQLSTLLAWYMDSTDAFLFLEYLENHGGERWIEVTESLLKTYLEQSPNQVPIVLARIMTQAKKDIKRDLLIGLQKSSKILERVKQFDLQVTQGNPGVASAQRWADILFRSDLNDEKTGQNKINLVNALLSKEVGELVGTSAQTTNLQGTMWLLKSLKKNPDLSRPFVTSFLTSFKEENLRNKLNTENNWSVQRQVLSHIGIFDQKLRTRLREAVKLKPGPRNSQDTFWWLTSGTLQWGESRWQRIVYLRGLGDDDLNDLMRLNHPLGWLQRLLIDANWLAPEEATRIAGMLPTIWPELKKKDVDFRNIALLMTHVRYVNPSVADDFVDLLIDDVEMFNTLLLKEHPKNLVGSLGRMLMAIEHATSGSIERWCDIHFRHLLPVLTSLDDKSLHEVLAVMSIYAPDNLKRAFVSQEIQQRLKYIQDNNQRWTRNGIIAANGLSSLTSSDAIIESKIEGFDTEFLTFVLYGMQTFLGMSSVISTLKQLAAITPLNPDVVGQFIQSSRYSHPWTAEQTISNLKAEMTPSLDPRTLAFQYIVMAGPELTWDTQWLNKQSNFKENDVYRVSANIRGLISAVFERLLWIKTTRSDPVVHATVNNRHPLAQKAQQQIETVIAPLTEQELTMQQWDEALGGKILLSDADRWRYRLLRAGKVRCDLGTNSERFEIKFAMVREPSRDLIRQLIFGKAYLT